MDIRIRVALQLLLVLCFMAPPVFAGEAQVYLQAIQAAKANSKDFAYMYYRALLRDYPNTKYREPALFAHGEYYSLLPDYDQSASAFQAFIQEFPDSKGKLFAWVHLLKIAQIQKDEALTKGLEKEIINFKQLSLVFRDFQEYRYQSSLGRKYRAVFQIDKIEFYVQGEMFAQIRY